MYHKNERLSHPKTALIGISGFLGKAFLTEYRLMHPDCLGTCRTPSVNGIFHLDLSAPDIGPLRLRETGHKEALILAAITKVAKCEAEKELSRKVNVDGTLELIGQLAAEGIKPIFFSSDYIFDGCAGGYADDAAANPITEYGRQKAQVEAKIREVSKGEFLVVRLSKVFSLTKGSRTLLDEMAAKLSRGEPVWAAYDQIFCPTLIDDLIKTVVSLQASQSIGIVNLCSPEVWSRYDLALALARELKIDANKVNRISLDELDMGLRRPKNTSMRIERLLSLTRCRWTPMRECLKITADNWKKK